MASGLAAMRARSPLSSIWVLARQKCMDRQHGTGRPRTELIRHSCAEASDQEPGLRSLLADRLDIRFLHGHLLEDLTPECWFIGHCS